MSPSRDTLSRNKGRREVEDSSLGGHTWRVVGESKTVKMANFSQSHKSDYVPRLEGCHVTVFFGDLA